MSIHIRQRNGGPTSELRIKHKLLPKPLYFTFASENEARRYGGAVEATLKRGIVPEGLVSHRKPAISDVAGAIDEYNRACAVMPDSAALLRTIKKDVGATKLEKVDYAWAESWVRAQKLEFVRTPGTIRHHVGALRRCLSWLVKTHPDALAANPLRLLERGYSTYNSFERRELALRGIDPRVDCERNRRLCPDEEQRIVEVLRVAIAGARTDEERARYEGMQLMFLLALETAMRMRELYTLHWAQIDMPRRTIFLTKTKNGESREVPLSTVACQLLSQSWPALAHAKQDGRLLPFWQGVGDEEELGRVTRRVSNYFSDIFDVAGCPDFVFHDTRHEATCRIVLRTSLSSVEISRITGHTDPRMLRRYMSLRGSELAEKLW